MSARLTPSARPLLRQLTSCNGYAQMACPRPSMQHAFSSSSRTSIAATPVARNNEPNRDYPGQDRNRASPARRHRADTTAASAGGPDVSPQTDAPRNASTGYNRESARSGAETLANIASNVGRLRAAPPKDNRGVETSRFGAPAVGQGDAAGSPQQQIAIAEQTQKANLETLLVPSGYSATSLALKSDPLLEAFVNNLMRDGKKASAQRHIAEMLQYLSQVLHADPLPALQSAIATASPLTRMQTRKQGGKNVQVPQALNEKQGRRKAIVTIIEASKKRGDRQLSVRLAKEICAILEGTSSVLQKKEELHRLATANRGNVSVRV